MLTGIGAAAVLTAAAVFLVWGVGAWTARHSETEHPYGMGGPAETTPASLLSLGALDLGRHADDSADGLVIQRQPGLSLPLRELGPVFRRDQGPAAMLIARGQTFYEALAARGVAHEDIMALVRATKSFRDLRSVKTGDAFVVHVTPDGGLRSLGFDLDDESYVTWVREGDTYARHDGTYPVEYRLRGVGGTIEASLYAALQELDAPLSLAPKMSDILGWDIDFKRDLRRGDTFRILYEEVWRDGRAVRTGAIKALEIVNRGQTRRAFLFETADGRSSYYDDEGHSMQKQLLRAPLRYSRISSGYSHRRLHPVLKRWMPHLGVDYAAPLGTPVKAGGDGVVVAATTRQGNGRYVHIRHTNSEYETFYLHLSRFAKGVRPGVRVTQGQVIGYVGASGYATGPHLDYRVRRNGRFADPRKLKLPAAAPVAAELRPLFTAQAQLLGDVLARVPGGGIVAVPPLVLPAAEPPGWNGAAYAAIELPETIRALP